MNSVSFLSKTIAETTNNYYYCVSYDKLLTIQHSWPETWKWLSVVC
jgi:hypothetical protein